MRGALRSFGSGGVLRFPDGAGTAAAKNFSETGRETPDGRFDIRRVWFPAERVEGSGADASGSADGDAATRAAGVTDKLAARNGRGVAPARKRRAFFSKATGPTPEVRHGFRGEGSRTGLVRRLTPPIFSGRSYTS